MPALIDITGRRFGRLLVLGRVPGPGRPTWACECDCGTSLNIKGTNLQSGTQSCGCLQREAAGRRASALVGRRFGRLTVIARAGSDHLGRASWDCLCDCGASVRVPATGALTSGNTKSCGCLVVETSKRLGAATLHDLTGRRFGHLLVLSRHAETRHGNVRWLCLCDCGREHLAVGSRLQTGRTGQCSACGHMDQAASRVLGNLYGDLA